MTGWQQATPQQNPTFPPIQPGRRRGRSEPGQQAYRITGSRTGRERSCYLVKLTKLYTKKGLPPDAEKSRTKKVSVCCPESGISDTLKESPAAGEAGPAAGFCKMRESAHEKKSCYLFRDFRGPKRRCAPRSGSHPGRSGVPDVELLQNVAQKRGYPRTGGYPRHRPGPADLLNRAKVCSKKRPVVPDRNGIPADRMLHCDKMLHKKRSAKTPPP